MTFEQKWLEYDYNPFILFSSGGKVLSLNAEAQFLLGASTPAEIFELATTYANVTFGFKTTFIDIEYDRYKFYGLTVGYENEDEIGIKLYQTPSFKINNPKRLGEITNIYTLVDLCISTNSISSNVTFNKEFDPTIPDIVINSNKFIKLLNKAYSCYLESEEINTKIFFRVGEYIKFDNKKYTLFAIKISADTINKSKLDEFRVFAQDSELFVDVKSTITLNIPIIQE